MGDLFAAYRTPIDADAQQAANILTEQWAHESYDECDRANMAEDIARALQKYHSERSRTDATTHRDDHRQ
jgi:hypothetical protein